MADDSEAKGQEMLTNSQSGHAPLPDTSITTESLSASSELPIKLLARGQAVSQRSVERIKNLQVCRFHQIIISVVDGWKRARRYVFDQRQLCLVGRAENCDIRLPNDFWHRRISHLHCLLEIDPPFVSLRDLESTNGTYVNGWKVRSQYPHVVVGQTQFSGMMLLKGDEIRIGGITLRVGIEDDVCEVDLSVAESTDRRQLTISNRVVS